MEKNRNQITKLTALNCNKTVRKSNALNEIRKSDFTYAEYRLFCIFLAHFKMRPINPKDVDMGKEPIYDNSISFLLSDYGKIAGLKRIQRTDFEKQINNITKKTVYIENDDGELSAVQVFTDVHIYLNEYGARCVTMKCNDALTAELREESRCFTRYKLHNITGLSSLSQIRIYELLKQYLSLGKRTVTLADLRELLSIKENEYQSWRNFNQRILISAQNALEESTDICFAYEPIKKNRRVVAVKFIIRANIKDTDNTNIDIDVDDSDNLKTPVVSHFKKPVKVRNTDDILEPLHLDIGKDMPRRDENGRIYYINFLLNICWEELGCVSEIRQRELIDYAVGICEKHNPDVTICEVNEFLRLTNKFFIRAKNRINVLNPVEYYKIVLKKDLVKYWRDYDEKKRKQA